MEEIKSGEVAASGEVAHTDEAQEAKATEQTLSAEDMMAELTRLRDTVKNNKTESYNHRQANKKLKEELEAIRNGINSEKVKTLEGQGQYKELYERKQQEAKELEKKLQEKDFMYMKKDLETKFYEKATKYGASSPRMAFNTANVDYKDMLEFDSNTLSVSEDSVEHVLEKMKLDHPSFFKADPVRIKDGQPSKVKSSTTKAFEDLDRDELKKLLARHGEEGHSF